MKNFHKKLLWFLVVLKGVLSVSGFRTAKEPLDGIFRDVTKIQDPTREFGRSLTKAVDSYQPRENAMGTVLKKPRPSDVIAAGVNAGLSRAPNSKSRPQVEIRVPSERNLTTENLTVEYVPGQENGTWNVGGKKTVPDVKQENPTCRVTTDESVATAQMTVAKALKELCNANDMNERFDRLENLFASQLNSVKNMLASLERRFGFVDEVGPRGQKHFSGASADQSCSRTSADDNVQGTDRASPQPDAAVVPSYDDGDTTGVRDPEILKFNSSIHMETGLGETHKKVFTYYWKIKDMAHKISDWNPRKSFRSQSFYIFPSGYRMYLRVYPRQNEDKFTVRVGLTKGEFDDSLKWPFTLKHKIHVLDQTKDGRVFEDIASRIWDPDLLCSEFNWQKPIKGDNHECVEISFPHDVLRHREYIRNDTLVLKLTVYLES